MAPTHSYKDPLEQLSDERLGNWRRQPSQADIELIITMPTLRKFYKCIDIPHGISQTLCFLQTEGLGLGHGSRGRVPA
jgi:hypothetical protein